MGPKQNSLFQTTLIVFSLICFGSFSSVNCQIKSFPFKVERNRTILPVKFNNSETLKIILDSGMAFDGLLIYNPDLRETLDLSNAVEVNIGGAGNGNASTALMLDSASFYIGDFERINQKIIVLNNDMYKGFPTDGVTGYSILGHFAVEINYDKNIITLHDYKELEPDDTWETVQIYFKDNKIPWIDVYISTNNEEPVKLSMYIDFASGDAIELLERDVNKFIIPENTEEAYLGRGLSGDIYGKTGYISKLIIGSFEFQNVKTSIAPAKVRSKQDNADAVLGNDALRRFNLIFDYKNKLLYLKPNKHFSNLFQ